MKQLWYYLSKTKVIVLFWIFYWIYISTYYSDSRNFLKTGFLFMSFCFTFYIFLEVNLILKIINQINKVWIKSIVFVVLMLIFGNISKFVAFFALNFSLQNLDLGTKKDFFTDTYFQDKSYSEVFYYVIGLIKKRQFISISFHLTPYILYMALWVQQSNKELLQIEKEKNQLQLKLLKSKVNPQIVNKAFDYIKSQSNELGQQMVLRLSSFLRYLLYESQKKAVTIEEELDFLVNFLEIAEHSMVHELTIDYKIKKSGSNQHIVKSLALYPLISEVVEKAISFIDINILLENHLLNLKITFDIKPNEALSNFEDSFSKEFENNYAYQLSQETNKVYINLVVNFDTLHAQHNENLQMLNS